MELAEILLRRLGGLLAYITLAAVFYGIWRGAYRTPGRTSGKAAGWLRSLLFYSLTSLCFLGISIIFWKPLPVTLPQGVHLTLLVVGSTIYFPAISLILWGRLALGKMYFVSTSFSAQLYHDHRLVRHGPYAIVRHPMYLGLVVAGMGSLLLYQTWTALGYAIFAPFVLLRARREEAALSAEFGKEWQVYCRRVPAFIPRLRKRNL
jgi:protein-S-isoprenylcysteine O-methyltransferase Ste14